jgi:hypothetical protein
MALCGEMAGRKRVAADAQSKGSLARIPRAETSRYIVAVGRVVFFVSLAFHVLYLATRALNQRVQSGGGGACW